MPKLLIVDDDEYIRNGLKHLIDWENLGIEIVGEAEGGNEGYAMFLSKAPHLVLTDIRMPGGNGLELMEKIRKKNWNTHLIVLSGYDDFSYVRQAMKYQVEDYLLKPVDPGELEEIAKSCVEQIESRWMDEQIRRETFQLLRNNVLNRWVENRIEDEQLREKLDFLKIRVAHTRLIQAAVIGWKDAREGALTEAERNFRSFAIYNAMDELLAEEGKGVAFLNAGQQIVCLLFGEGKDAEAFADANLAWLRSASEKCSGLLKTPWYCAIGKPAERLHLAHVSYGDALRLLDGMEQTGPAQCADRRSLAAASAEAGHEASDHGQIVPALAAGRREEWESALERDFAVSLEQDDPLAAAKYIASEWIATVKEALRLLRAEDARQRLPEELFARPFASATVPAIRQDVLRLLEAVDEIVRELSSHEKNRLTVETERYLREHFREELTLQMVANELHVSPIYLGRLFKAETGEFFSDYLNRLRLEDAMQQLAGTSLKASEIASLCGFSDSNYFFRKFKQKIGMSPTEYRTAAAAGMRGELQ
ncbi:response regulator transcription factor [Cohnella sp. LGH]|uniref:response regulator transcription factor n=1 Tax=Cohnella sp. LGH TaxID=1619153 RepID=UPI001AD9A089|nr:response regulator transcription factor [Cohnella sp. LGH]QTH42065.1 response regulator transcription factor [Cohnella sp. LGH]